MDPRAREEVKLERCAAAARGGVLAVDAEEASVFLLAARLLPSELGVEAGRLFAAAESFRAAGSAVDAGEVVRRGLVVSLPRFRQGLVERLKRAPA